VLAAGFPHIDHICIASEQLGRFRKNESDKMLCKLHSIENLRLFEKFPTAPHSSSASHGSIG